MDIGNKLHIEKWISKTQSKQKNQEKTADRELAQDIMQWINGGKSHQGGELYTKWNKI